MALRSLYLILAKSVEQMHYLKHAVAAILAFVGVKMVAEYFHFAISSFASLSVIYALLAAGAYASVVHNRRNGIGGGAGAKSPDGAAPLLELESQRGEIGVPVHL